MNDGNIKWLWMQRTFGTATRRAHEAYERYGPPEELLSTPLARIESDGFFTDEEKTAIKSPDLAACGEILDRAESFGAFVLTPDSGHYPESLRNIYSIPLVLYGMGDASLLRGHYLISMVGTRNPDEYGAAAAKKLSGEIASLGGVVVSGLAYGIDAFCHRAALEAGGKTVAFIAGGLDLDYPKRNRALRSLIERPENGLVLSEYPMGTQAYPHNFPMRNRLISGVSMATVIVQSAINGGTMLTAGHAISQSRDLFAVPGSILSPLGEGCNHLLSQGAEPAVSGEAIMRRYAEIYGYPVDQPNNQQTSLFSGGAGRRPEGRAKPRGEEQPPDHLNELQARILGELCRSQRQVDDLCESLSAPAGEVLTALTGLELFGLAEILPGRIARRRIT